MKLLLCTFGLIVLLVVVESIPAEISQPSLRKKGSGGGGFGGGGFGGGGFGGSFVEIPHYTYTPEYVFVEHHGHGHGHGHHHGYGHGHGCLFKSSGKYSGCYESDLSELAGYLSLLEKYSRIVKPAAPESGSGGYQYPKPPNAANAETILNRLRDKTLTNKA